MPTVIMPKMGDAMEEGTLLKWLKGVGETVEAGEPIAEIETDKVTLELEAEEGGVLTQTLVGEGESVPVGTPVATIGEESEAERRPGGETESEAVANGRAAAEAAPARAPAAVGGNGAARAVPAPEAPAQVGGNGAGAPPRAPGERLRASPLVKRLAAEHGIDLTNVAGSGPGGRIIKDDIASLLTGATRVAPAPTPAAAPAAPAAAPQPAPAPLPTVVESEAPAAVAPPPAGRPAGEVRELSRIRRTTGKRMAEAKRTIPHFYVTAEIDMAPAMAFRARVNAEVGNEATKLTFNDLIVKAAALALREFPNLNTSYQNDQLVAHPNIDINIAVALDGGLIAPFIPNADEKSLGAISRLTKDLANRARHGGLKPEEYQGGTFTVSNLGMFDVDQFIAVINPPQAAILSVGSIQEQPVVQEGEIAVGHRMKVAVAADHRVTDGAEVARFLGAIKRYLQNPMLLALS